MRDKSLRSYVLLIMHSLRGTVRFIRMRSLVYEQLTTYADTCSAGDPTILRQLEDNVATVPESPTRDIVFDQVRDRVKGVARHSPMLMSSIHGQVKVKAAPVAYWHGGILLRTHYESHDSRP